MRISLSILLLFLAITISLNASNALYFNRKIYHNKVIARDRPLKGKPTFSLQPGSNDEITVTTNKNGNKIFTVKVNLGDGFQPIDCQFRPLFEKSTFFTVTYDIPFKLNVDKPNRDFPAPVVTKDSSLENGERIGDVLRATTCWSQGFNAAGVTSDIMMFAGNVRWRKSVFDVTGAPWQEVIQALTSNTERSNTVTLVFEREIEDDNDQI